MPKIVVIIELQLTIAEIFEYSGSMSSTEDAHNVYIVDDIVGNP